MVEFVHENRGMGFRNYLICIALGAVCLFSSCERAPVVTHAAKPEEAPVPSPLPKERQIRAMGTVQAEKSITVLVPQLAGQGGGRFTLTSLIPNMPRSFSAGTLSGPGDSAWPGCGCGNAVDTAV